MRFLKIFASCLLLLGVLKAMANVFMAIIRILEEFTWPGTVISYGIFLVVGENFFDHPVAFDIFQLIFNAAIFATVVFIVLKLVRIAARKP